MRFEKSQDPVNTVRGLARAVALLRMYRPVFVWSAGWRMWLASLDDASDSFAGRVVESQAWERTSREEVRQILEALQFGVADGGDGVFSVSVPIGVLRKTSPSRTTWWKRLGG